VKITILGYELNITLQKIPCSRRIVCIDCGKMTFVWEDEDIDICEHCYEAQSAADDYEDWMQVQAERSLTKRV
jgi:hypothetical protein